MHYSPSLLRANNVWKKGEKCHYISGEPCSWLDKQLFVGAGLKKHPTLTQLLQFHPLSSADYSVYNNVTSPEMKAAAGDQSNLSHNSSDSDFY
jgi:hypothetical protein